MTQQYPQSDSSPVPPRLTRVRLVTMTGQHQPLVQPDEHPPENQCEVQTIPEVEKSPPGSRSDHSLLLRGIAGLLIGVLLLALTLRLVKLADIIHTLHQHLTTPRGIFFLLLASLAFISAFIFRALRWRLFLYPVRQVAAIKVIQVFLVGVFLNFVLPLRIGELAKCFILKRTKKIAIAHSLPTITMDKVLDLLPAFVVIVMVPVLGKQMDIKLWSVLAFAVGGLVGLTLFVALLTWKRTVALSLLHRATLLLPRAIQEKIECFVTSFVDALLTSVSRPRIFVPAVLLTSVAVCLDALYNMFAFWTVGYSISFEQAVFGYLLFNLFYILPTPPGQVGSNEVVGLLIFTGLLSIPVEKVITMIVLFHTWSGLLMCVMGMGSLSALGISLGHAVNIQHAQERHTTMSDHT